MLLGDIWISLTLRNIGERGVVCSERESNDGQVVLTRIDDFMESENCLVLAPSQSQNVGGIAAGSASHGVVRNIDNFLTNLYNTFG